MAQSARNARWKLPVELDKRIVRELDWDTRSLCCAALVCSGWQHESHTILFAHIKVGVYAIRPPDHYIIIDSMQKFIRFARARVTRYLRVLVIEANGRIALDNLMFDALADADTMNLDSVIIQARGELVSLASAPRPLIHVKTVRLISCTFLRAQDCANVLALFCHAEEIHMERCTQRGARIKARLEVLPPACAVRLETPELLRCGAKMPYLFSWMAKQQSNISTLELQFTLLRAPEIIADHEPERIRFGLSCFTDHLSIGLRVRVSLFDTVDRNLIAPAFTLLGKFLDQRCLILDVVCRYTESKAATGEVSRCLNEWRTTHLSEKLQVDMVIDVFGYHVTHWSSTAQSLKTLLPHLRRVTVVTMDDVREEDQARRALAGLGPTVESFFGTIS